MVILEGKEEPNFDDAKSTMKFVLDNLYDNHPTTLVVMNRTFWDTKASIDEVFAATRVNVEEYKLKVGATLDQFWRELGQSTAAPEYAIAKTGYFRKVEPDVVRHLLSIGLQSPSYYLP